MKLFSPAWCPTQRKWMHESDSKQNKTPLFYHSLGHMDFIFSCIFHLFGLPAAILGLPARFLSHCWGYSSLNAVGQQLHSSISELKNHVNVEKIDLQRKCSLTHQKLTIVIQDGVHPSLCNLDQIGFINVSANFHLTNCIRGTLQGCWVIFLYSVCWCWKRTRGTTSETHCPHSHNDCRSSKF